MFKDLSWARSAVSTPTLDPVSQRTPHGTRRVAFGVLSMSNMFPQQVCCPLFFWNPILLGFDGGVFRLAWHCQHLQCKLLCIMPSLLLTTILSSRQSGDAYMLVSRICVCTNVKLCDLIGHKFLQRGAKQPLC